MAWLAAKMNAITDVLANVIITIKCNMADHWSYCYGPSRSYAYIRSSNIRIHSTMKIIATWCAF